MSAFIFNTSSKRRKVNVFNDNLIDSEKLYGNPISNTAPTSSQVLAYNGTTWSPTASSGIFTPGGDLGGTATSQTLVAIKGYPLATNVNPTVGQFLIYGSGNTWGAGGIAADLSLTDGLFLPTPNGTATKMQSYQYIIVTPVITGPGSQTAGIYFYFTKVGQQVTMVYPNIMFSGGSASNYVTSSGTVPANMVPSFQLSLVVLTNITTTSNGFVNVNPNGTLVFYPNGSGTFSSTQGIYAGSVSWICAAG